MVATTTPKASSVYKQIVDDYPDIKFVIGNDFSWSPDKQTVYHPSIKNYSQLYQLLHEVGHAKLEHRDYPSDASLIDMELAAWQYTVDKLAPRYGLNLSIDDPLIESALDSYRQWLHDRSICPHCGAIGLEKSPGRYSCLSCQQDWRVNEARSCQLRRYKK